MLDWEAKLTGAPAMPNRCGRCRMHGGKSLGAPKGNRNAWKHGNYSAEGKEMHRELRKLIRRSQELITEV